MHWFDPDEKCFENVFYLNCLGFEATGKPGRYLAFLGKLQIFQMVSIFIEHFKERNSKLNFPNLHVAEKLLSHQLCYACTRKSHLSSWSPGWPGRWGCLIWLINCHNFPDHFPHHPDLQEYVGPLPSPILTRQVLLFHGCFSVNNGARKFYLMIAEQILIIKSEYGEVHSEECGTSWRSVLTVFSNLI